MRFSDSGSYSNASNLPSGNSYTVLFWYNLTADTNTWQEFVLHDGTANHYFETRTDGTNLTFSGGSGEVGNFASTLGTWYCAAASVNGTSVTVYHGTSPTSLSSTSGSCSDLGTCTNMIVGNGVNGRMNNLKVYNAALTEEQISQELSQYVPLQLGNMLRWHPLISDVVDYLGGNNLSGTGGTIEDGPPIRWARSRGPRVGASIPSQDILPTGIASAEAFGTATLTVGGVLAPTGIPSAEAFGTAAITAGPVSVSPTGIASAEAFGTASVQSSLALTGIPSAEAFGTTAVRLTISLTGIPSAEAFGPQILQYTQTLTLTGIPSAEFVGSPELTITIDTAVRALTPRLRTLPIYELLVMGRIPQQNGAPAFLLADPIDWSTITWSTTLSKPQSLSVNCKASTLTDAVKVRLAAPHRWPTELWLQRNGKTVFAGPLLGGSENGDELSLEASGIMAYLDWMYVTTDLRYAAVDQFTIVADLIDRFQSLEYANYGIVTANVGTSGVTRDITYDRKEIHQLSRKIDELGVSSQGFDAEIDPTTRALQLWYPSKGVDRSTGEDAIVFDGASIDGLGGMFSITPNDFATDAYGAGTEAGGEKTFWSEQGDTELRAIFGRAGIAGSWSDIADQGTLDNYVAALRDSRGTPLRVPGKRVKVTPDTDLDTYDVGDTISYQISGVLGIEGAFRIRSRSVSVDQSGQESVTLEFV